MIFLETNNRRENRFNRIYIVAIIFIIIILVLIQLLFPHILSSIFITIAKPFWRIEFAVSSGSMKSQRQLLLENETLKIRLQEKDIKSYLIQSIEQENQSLKQFFAKNRVYSNSESTSTDAMEIVPILMNPPFAPYDELIIDGGKDLGFTAEMVVYAYKGIPIGKIKEVLRNTSKVVLYSSPGIIHDVIIGREGIRATATGNGGGQYSLELPRSIVVKEGDLVTVPSYDGDTIGIVSKVINDEAQPFETIIFAPPVNIFDLRWVLIDKKDQE
ncbi:MAG: rod shape-determining protein MreC [Candidatus Paceibacterota bacterium]|jgi:cell shape-determining protein MreC